MSATPDSDDTWKRSLVGESVGKFRLVEFVGAGKIGYVYRAQRSDVPAIDWAVKLTFDQLKEGWQVEITKVMKLALVDGVVHYHDQGAETLTRAGISKLCQYTVWDYVAPGENLKSYLGRAKTVPASFVFAVVERILHVLHACEAQGVVRHGDLHSGNIIIGSATAGRLDDFLEPRAPIYLSDFGYGATGGTKVPKDDYQGLALIINEMVSLVDYGAATATHKQMLQALKQDLGKLLREPAGAERRPPLDVLKVLRDIRVTAQANGPPLSAGGSLSAGTMALASSSVGQFQVSEMIGDKWEWWKRLFVPTVPARSKILALDIPTVVTGPRGCGKTMLFRRLSERLVVECGPVADLPAGARFVALYINANDIADAFAHFPAAPTLDDEARLTYYANLCILAELLSVQSARSGREGESASESLLALVQRWLITDPSPLIVGEDRLERYRAALEQIKWSFPRANLKTSLPGFDELSQHRWLPAFVREARGSCGWIGDKSVLVFVDDFSTPRVSASMQRVLNRLFLQRSSDFLAKVATEAWTTFVPEDSSGKNLQDGDDYQFVDMGEESLFLPDAERLAFLQDVFLRRLAMDTRLSGRQATLGQFLGHSKISKTEFARRLRVSFGAQVPSQQIPVAAESQRRGRSRARVLYFGEDIFADLWSGDTRTMIQLISDVLDQASEAERTVSLPIDSSLQDRVFRNRGGEWLNSHTRNEPTCSCRTPTIQDQPPETGHGVPSSAVDRRMGRCDRRRSGDTRQISVMRGSS